MPKPFVNRFAQGGGLYAVPNGPQELDRSGPFALGLVGYWPLIGDANDLTEHNVNGSAWSGSPAAAPTPYGPAMTLNGANGLVFGKSYSYSYGFPLTYSLQVYLPAIGGAGALVFDDGGEVGSTGENHGVGFGTNAPNWMVPFWGVSFQDTGVAATIGWHTIALVITSASQALLYVDGKLIFTGSSVMNAPQPTNLFIGQSGETINKFYFTGSVLDFAIFNRQLSATEIAGIAAQPFQLLRPRARRSRASYIRAISLDVLSPVEWRATARTDLVAPQENLATGRIDILSPTEYRGSSRIDLLVPDEYRATFKIDLLQPQENAATARSDLVAPLENPATLRVDTIVPSEALANTRLDVTTPLEQRASILLDQVMPLEWQGSIPSVMLDVGAPLEWLGSARLDAVVPLESLLTSVARGSLTLIAAPVVSAEGLSWARSLARTLSLAPLLDLPARAGPGALTSPLRWPSKAAVETLDYSLDATPLLADAADAIARVTVAVSPGGPVVLAVSWSAGVVTFWLAGGAPLYSAEITVTIVTAAGRVWPALVYLWLR